MIWDTLYTKNENQLSRFWFVKNAHLVFIKQKRPILVLFFNIVKFKIITMIQYKKIIKPEKRTIFDSILTKNKNIIQTLWIWFSQVIFLKFLYIFLRLSFVYNTCAVSSKDCILFINVCLFVHVTATPNINFRNLKQTNKKKLLIRQTTTICV